MEPFEREHRADDVDDRVERADLVQVNLLDGNLMDSRFGFAETMEELFRALLSRAAERAERSISELISARLRCA